MHIQRKRTGKMVTIKEQLFTVFTKITGGTVSMEEGSMLLNDLARSDEAETVKELEYLLMNPPQNVPRMTVFQTMVFARNKACISLIAQTLDSDDEELVAIAAEELSRFNTDEATEVLLEHLNAEGYHTRKVCAEAIALGFGAYGVRQLKEHILDKDEALFRDTSALALLQSGRLGIVALIEVLSSGKEVPVNSVVEALVKAPEEALANELKQLIDALMLAGDRDDPVSIIGLLKVIASLGGRAASYEDFILAFEDNLSGLVRNEAGRTLGAIRV